MKTDNLGLVPCKNPGTLLELLPSVLEVDRFPLTLTGINQMMSFLILRYFSPIQQHYVRSR